MGIKILDQAKEKLVKFSGRFFSFFDRDRFKTGISPDSDWEHNLVFVVVVVLTLALISGYLYFSVDQKTISLSSIKPGDGMLSKSKVIGAAALINKEKEEYNSLIAQPPKVEDPSR